MLDAIEDDVKTGGYIIDWHVCDVFPKSWIDLVVVLRTNNTVLYDRLKGRGYSGTTNIISHIFWSPEIGGANDPT